MSSSGQLSLALTLILGLQPGEAYRLSIASHLGTAGSGAIVAWREIADALRGGPWLRVALIPLLAGAPVAVLIEHEVTGLSGDAFNILIGVLLLATSIILLAQPRAKPSAGARRPEDLTARELLLVGVLQGLAALPGLSRSAITIAGLLLLGLDPEGAVRASIAMGTAATAAAALYEILSAGPAPPGPLAAMLLTSLVAGLASAGAMIGLARRLRDRLAIFTLVIAVLAIISGLPLIHH